MPKRKTKITWSRDRDGDYVAKHNTYDAIICREVSGPNQPSWSFTVFQGPQRTHHGWTYKFGDARARCEALLIE